MGSHSKGIRATRKRRPKFGRCPVRRKSPRLYREVVATGMRGFTKRENDVLAGHLHEEVVTKHLSLTLLPHHRDAIYFAAEYLTRKYDRMNRAVTIIEIKHGLDKARVGETHRYKLGHWTASLIRQTLLNCALTNRFGTAPPWRVRAILRQIDLKFETNDRFRVRQLVLDMKLAIQNEKRRIRELELLVISWDDMTKREVKS